MGEASAAKLDAIPMSNNTIQRRISDMAADVKEQVLDAIRKSPFFSIQLDESTDVANCAQLMVYVCFIKELGVQEEFLFCHPAHRSRGAHAHAATRQRVWRPRIFICLLVLSCL